MSSKTRSKRCSYFGQGVFAGAGVVDFVAVGGEGSAKDAADLGLVVDDQDAARGQEITVA